MPPELNPISRMEGGIRYRMVRVKTTGMDSQRIQFTGSQGFTLDARIDTPKSRDITHYALFAHCFTCSKNYKAVVNISKALTARGFGVFRFDFTGLGESEGDFSDTNFTSNVEDLISAADYMTANMAGPEILIGHSLGGTAVMQAASRIRTCRAVVTIAAPSGPKHLARILEPHADDIENRGEARVNIAGRPFTVKKQLLDDLKSGAFQNVIATLNKPLIVFHSPFDTVVNIEQAAMIFTAARHPKSFISLDTADHLLSDERDSRYVGNLIAEWSVKYIS